MRIRIEQREWRRLGVEGWPIYVDKQAFVNEKVRKDVITTNNSESFKLRKRVQLILAVVT